MPLSFVFCETSSTPSLRSTPSVLVMLKVSSIHQGIDTETKYCTPDCLWTNNKETMSS